MGKTAGISRRGLLDLRQAVERKRRLPGLFCCGTGLEETVVEPKPACPGVRRFSKSSKHADGSCWELGHGAIGVTYPCCGTRCYRRRVALNKVIEGASRQHAASQAVREPFSPT